MCGDVPHGVKARHVGVAYFASTLFYQYRTRREISSPSIANAILYIDLQPYGHITLRSSRDLRHTYSTVLRLSFGGGRPRDLADSCIISRAWRWDCAHMRGLRAPGGATSLDVDANIEPPHSFDALDR